MLPFLVGLMPYRAALILGAVLLALATAFGLGWKVNGDRWEAKYTKQELRHSQELNLQAEAAISALETYRRLEAALKKAKDEAEAKDAETIKFLETKLAAAVVERDRLRAQIASYSRGPANPADDSLSAARHRAETLGVLLGQADERAQRDAEELEQLNREKALLLAAWPRGPSDAEEQ